MPFVYVINNSNTEVWLIMHVEVTQERSRILQENHYYPYGLQIASISSKAAGKMDNMYRYQGAYSDFEEETGWNDFELRTYDAQVGRFIQQDPYDQYASGYVGMGNDPVNGVDPNGGWGINLGSVGDITGSILGDRLLAAGAGTLVGYGIDKLTGGKGGWGAAIGAGVGFGATFIPPFDIGAVESALKDAAPSIARGTNVAVNSYVTWAKYTQNTLPPFSTLLSNYPLPYNIRPDRTPINPQLPVNDQTGENFMYYNQCAIRVCLSLRRSGVDISGARNITNPQAGSKGAYANGNILGATNLAGFLFKYGQPQVFNGTKDDVASKLNNKTGIIYFQSYNENYGTNRPPERSNTHVHIDLWNRNRIMAPYLGQMLDATRILFWGIQ